MRRNREDEDLALTFELEGAPFQDDVLESKPDSGKERLTGSLEFIYSASNEFTIKFARFFFFRSQCFIF